MSVKFVILQVMIKAILKNFKYIKQFLPPDKANGHEVSYITWAYNPVIVRLSWGGGAQITYPV